MKVLQINNWSGFRGGSDRVFLETSDGLRNLGFQVIQFSPTTASGQDGYSGSNFNVTLPDEWGGGIGSALRAVYNKKAGTAMARLLEAHPDICIAHLHIYHSRLTAAILRPLFDAGIPIVQTAHEYKLICPNYSLFVDGEICTKCVTGSNFNCVLHRCKGGIARSTLAWVEHEVSNYFGARSAVDTIICISKFQQRMMQKAGIQRDKLALLYNGVNLDAFSPKTSNGDKSYYLYFGRLAPTKGLQTLLKAFSITGHSLILAGDGPLEDSVKAAAASAENIKFLGKVTGEELSVLVASAKAVVVPSEWHEPFGLTVIEAQASGTPVIGAKVGAIPELILEGVTGYTFAAGSVTGLVSAVRRMELADHYAMGSAARSSVEEHFSFDTYLRGLCDVYARTIKDFG